MLIKVNGNDVETDKSNLLDFLNAQEYELGALVVEYNFNIVKKDEWETIVIKENDNLEVLSFVGGG